jgi:small GTP-binding protein
LHEAPTVGASYHSIDCDTPGGQITLQIWDTAGQEKYKSLGSFYYQGAIGAIAVFAITNRESFDGISDWISAFHDVAGTDGCVFIAANKTDLADQRVVSDMEANGFAEKKGFPLYTVSAKTGEAIRDLIDDLAKAIALKLDDIRPPVDIAVEATESGDSCC